MSVGWTKAEYDQCPELAGRLHSHILDVEDAAYGLASLVNHAALLLKDNESDEVVMWQGIAGARLARFVQLTRDEDAA